MADELSRVLDNYNWRMEAVSPRSTIGIESFRAIDPLGVEPGESDGLTRCFWVEWLGSGPGHTTEDSIMRVADHAIVVSVVYSHDYRWQDRHKLMVSDRHDILKALRDDSKWVGYSDTNSSTDIKLKDRQYVRTQKQVGDDYDLLVLEFNNTIYEVE